MTDSEHCGRCGMACLATETCSAGTCTTMMMCGAGMRDCGAGCIDVQSNNMNCGTCGRVCASGETCMMGSCAMTMCPAGQMRCGAACVDVATDESNCGMCGMACPAGQECTASACVPACPAPRMVCGTGAAATCVDTTTDAANCGMCGRACTADQVCTGGTCACGMGRMSCGSPAACVDTTTDNANCGMCGRACPAGQTCAGSMCTCPAPTTLCGSACTITAIDSMNCGMCGRICSGGTPTCVMGTCMASSCTGGQIPCGSPAMCVNPQTDNMNCGGCGMACGAGTSCVTGLCRPTNDLRAMGVAVTLAAGAEIMRTGSTVRATNDAPAGECSGCSGGGNVWYRVTLPEAGVFYADTQGSTATLDTKLLVTNAAGTILTAGTGEVWCQDDNVCGSAPGWGNRDSRVYGYLAAGTYDVSVGGCGSGTFTLHMQFIPASSASFFIQAPASGNAVTPDMPLVSASVASSPTCGGTSSGEDARWFVTCGGQPQDFSLCRSDGVGFLGLSHPEYERTNGTLFFDPRMYLRSAQTGAEVSCNDDGGTMGGTDCQGYDSSMGGAVGGSAYGSRLNDIVVPRGIAEVFVDSSSGGSGMNYRLLHRIVDAP